MKDERLPMRVREGIKDVMTQIKDVEELMQPGVTGRFPIKAKNENVAERIADGVRAKGYHVVVWPKDKGMRDVFSVDVTAPKIQPKGVAAMRARFQGPAEPVTDLEEDVQVFVRDDPSAIAEHMAAQWTEAGDRNGSVMVNASEMGWSRDNIESAAARLREGLIVDLEIARTHRNTFLVTARRLDPRKIDIYVARDNMKRAWRRKREGELAATIGAREVGKTFGDVGEGIAMLKAEGELDALLDTQEGSVTVIQKRAMSSEIAATRVFQWWMLRGGTGAVLSAPARWLVEDEELLKPLSEYLAPKGLDFRVTGMPGQLVMRVRKAEP